MSRVIRVVSTGGTIGGASVALVVVAAGAVCPASAITTVLTTTLETAASSTRRRSSCRTRSGAAFNSCRFPFRRRPAQAGEPRQPHCGKLQREVAIARLPVPSSDWLAKATSGRFPRPDTAHLLSRPPRRPVKHLVPLQLQWGRKLATIPPALQPPTASSRQNARARCRINRICRSC